MKFHLYSFKKKNKKKERRKRKEEGNKWKKKNRRSVNIASLLINIYIVAI
jgi:hypothetical protein